MTTNEVSVRLGPCSDRTTFADGSVLWTYWLHPFRDEGNGKELYVLAARLSITNGRVEYVGYLRATERIAATQETPPSREGLKGLGAGNTKPCLLTLSVIHSNRVEGSHFIDSPIFPNLGYLPAVPEVMIAKLRTVVIERHPPAEVSQQAFPGWSFGIYLTEQDSVLLQSFTHTNVSRRILISVCGEPVSAPTLLSPIDNGSLVFDCKNRVVAELLERELTQMAREEPPSPHPGNGR